MTPPLNRRDFLAQAAGSHRRAGRQRRRPPWRVRPLRDQRSPRARPTWSRWARPASRSRWWGWAPAASAAARPATRPGWASRNSPGWSATRSTTAFCFFDVADQYGSHVYLREALEGRSPRPVRHPDQDPRDQPRRRPEPPRALSPGAGCRLHRHRAACTACRRRAGRPRIGDRWNT